MVAEKILNRIKKLLSFSKDNATASEVANALRLAKKLMDKHGIAEADVTVHDQEVSFKPSETSGGDSQGSATFKDWELLLMMVVDLLFAVKHYILVGAHGQRTMFLGTKTEVTLASYAFKHLRKQLQDMAVYHYGEDWTFEHATYLRSVIGVIGRKATIQKEEQKGQATGSSLVVIDKKAQKLNELLSKLGKLKRKVDPAVKEAEQDPAKQEASTMAKMLGSMDGHNVNLNFRESISDGSSS